MPVKSRITVNLTVSEYQKLLELSDKTERSLAWLGRRAILDLLEKGLANAPARNPKQGGNIRSASL